MRKTFFLFALLIILTGISFPVFKILADMPLEVEYPPLPTAFPPQTVERTAVGDYARYIFYFAIAASGFVALISLIMAGFNYLTSSGQLEKIKTAKEQIKAVIFGLVILFGSVLVLKTINPNILEFNIPGLRPSLPTLSPGILLCKQKIDFIYTFWTVRKPTITDVLNDSALEKIKEKLEEWQKTITENCWLVSTSGDIPEEFNDKLVQAHVIPADFDPQKIQRYGAILYEESRYGGKNQVVYTSENEPAQFDISKLKASSVKVFIIDNEVNKNSYVELFELIDSNEAYNITERKQYGVNYYKINVENNFRCYPIGKTLFDYLPKKEGIKMENDHQFQSVNIEGDLIVIFFKNRKCGERYWKGIEELYAMTEGDARLNDNRPIGEWCNGPQNIYPCATSIVVVSGGIY